MDILKIYMMVFMQMVNSRFIQSAACHTTKGVHQTLLCKQYLCMLHEFYHSMGILKILLMVFRQIVNSRCAACHTAKGVHHRPYCHALPVQAIGRAT